jgi:hypothetical protein
MVTTLSHKHIWWSVAGTGIAVAVVDITLLLNMLLLVLAEAAIGDAGPSGSRLQEQVCLTHCLCHWLLRPT